MISQAFKKFIEHILHHFSTVVIFFYKVFSKFVSGEIICSQNGDFAFRIVELIGEGRYVNIFKGSFVVMFFHLAVQVSQPLM